MVQSQCGKMQTAGSHNTLWRHIADLADHQNRCGRVAQYPSCQLRDKVEDMWVKLCGEVSVLANTCVATGHGTQRTLLSDKGIFGSPYM